MPGFSTMITKVALKKAGRKDLLVSSLPELQVGQCGERCLASHLKKEKELSPVFRLE